MTYATLNQLKDQLGITDSTKDGYLADLLERVSAWINTQTNRVFVAAETVVTDQLYERNGPVIWLGSTGITDITVVKAKQLRSESYLTLDPTTYYWTSNGRLELPVGYAFVQVSFEHGAGVPRDIELACLGEP